MRWSIVAICALTAAPPRSIAQAICDLRAHETVESVEIVDNVRFRSADGRTIRLANIVLEKNLPDDHFANLMSNPKVTLSFDERVIDRNGHVLAQVSAGEVWVQRTIIEQGLARVTSWPDLSACAEMLLAAERNARERRAGRWGDGTYKIVSPEELRSLIRSFQIVRGIVKSVKAVRDVTYVNFGDDYRSDFTLTLERKALKLFAKQNLNPADWIGATLQVRGFVGQHNGPLIEITHPAQIEVMSPAK